MDRIELEDILREALTDVAPDFYIEEDEQGQLIVVTGLIEDDNEELVTFDSEDVEDDQDGLDPDLESLGNEIDDD